MSRQEQSGNLQHLEMTAGLVESEMAINTFR